MSYGADVLVLLLFSGLAAVIALYAWHRMRRTTRTRRRTYTLSEVLEEHRDP